MSKGTFDVNLVSTYHEVDNDIEDIRVHRQSCFDLGYSGPCLAS